jgi:hypothetical protein
MMTTKIKEMIARMVEIAKRREKGGLKRIQMRGIIYVVVERATCPMQHSILMPRRSIRAYSPKEQLIFKRKGSKVLVQTVGKLIAATAICLRPMNSTKGSKNLWI